jgi:hypothetical protein
MVQAIREGRKTQTRRIVKPQPPEQPLPNCHPKNSAKHPAPYLDAYCNKLKTATNPRGMSDLWCWWQVDDRQCLPTFRCPYGQPGDRLWVRETWAPHADMPTRAAIYRCDRGGDYQDTTTPNFRWSPSIHMPRWASRITLEIVSVRVERLNDISTEDAELEGCNRFVDSSGSYDARVQFCELWESINGVGSWDLNPWVWVIEFKEAKP